jgi:hypothetical protein
MKALYSHAGTRHRRRRFAPIALTLALLIAAVAGLLWWTLPGPLTDEERLLIGVWSYRWDGVSRELGLEYEFRPDRTCVVRNFDPITDKLISETGATWRLSGGRLVVSHPAGRTGLWRLVPGEGAVEEVSLLTADGEGRFRYTARIDVAGQFPVTGTMTQVGHEQ